MIKFEIGDEVTVDQAYTENTLKDLAATAEAVATLECLGYCGEGSCTVLAKGILPPPKEHISFIRVVPKDPYSAGYHKGEGITLFFDDADQLNSSFTLPGSPASEPEVVETEVVETEVVETEVVSTEESAPVEEEPTPDDVDEN
jgi:hypothetical protein